MGGREMARNFQQGMTTLLKRKESMAPTAYAATASALAGKLRANLASHRDQNLDMRRMELFTVRDRGQRQTDKSRMMAMKGSVQPMRISEFEPMVFALAKIAPRLPARYGAQRSRVLNMVVEAKK